MATFPTELIQSASTIESINDGLVTTTAFNGVRFTRQRSNSQMWSFTISFVIDCDPKSFKSAFSQLAQLNQSFNVVEIVHPLYKASEGPVSGNITLLANHSRGDSAVTLTGLDPLITGIMRRGDFIRFANSSKVYILTSDFDSNGVGDATANIYPSLRKNTPISTQMIYSDVEFTMISDDSISMQLNSPQNATFADILFVEKLD